MSTPSSPSPLLRRIPRLRALALAALAVAVLAAVAVGVRTSDASANTTQLSIMQDDNQLVYRNDATREAALAQMKALGVDYVRVTVLWSNVANGIVAYDHKHHIKFNPANPATYPPHNWDRYDRLVENAQQDGIGVYFDVTGPGPSYAHGKAPKSIPADVASTWMPSPQQFYYFVTAIGRRYSGSYRAHGQVIPRVNVWSLWNEPNQGGWITPQWYRVDGQLIDYSAVLYRQLYLYGRQALQLTGHGRDNILIGETSPLGVARKTMTSEIDPTTFIRELMCANASNQPYTGKAASIRDCQVFSKFGGAFQSTGWAHHPYTKYDAPAQVDKDPNAITVANIAVLPQLLDALSGTTHHVVAGLPILSTEDGYETKPPDPFFGIPLATQTAYINEDDYLLYQQPRVYANTQFLLRDAAPLAHTRKGSRQYWSTYQSGLEYANGSPKPSFSAYAFPFDTYSVAANPLTGTHQIGIWGQLRFLAHSPGLGVQSVQVEFHPNGAPANAFTPVGQPIRVIDLSHHFFTATVPDPGAGQIRLHWASSSVNRYTRAIAVSA